LLTFVCVAVAMVLFRAPNLQAALDVLQGMVGLNGVSLPQKLVDSAGPLGAILRGHVILTGPGSGRDIAVAGSWIVGSLAIVLMLPNSLQITSRYEPALALRSPPRATWLDRSMVWGPSIGWAGLFASLAVVAVTKLGGKSEFLYWQF
jgi:hypothetical protein